MQINPKWDILKQEKVAIVQFFVQYRQRWENTHQISLELCCSNEVFWNVYMSMQRLNISIELTRVYLRYLSIQTVQTKCFHWMHRAIAVLIPYLFTQ